jgi:hypothetical protein
MNQTTIIIPGVCSPLISALWKDDFYKEIITVKSDGKHISIALEDKKVAVLPIALLDMAVYISEKIN